MKNSNVQSLRKWMQGWLPKEPLLVYATKLRWRKPTWIALSLTAVLALGFAVYVGVQTYIRYSNPVADVTASYFEKSLNCTSANAGDIVEVTVLVNWHGYVLPEFKREVKITDPFPIDTFELVGGNNTLEYSGYGGGYQFKYQLKIVHASAEPLEMPRPTLYLDNTKITLTGNSPVLAFQAT